MRYSREEEAANRLERIKLAIDKAKTELSDILEQLMEYQEKNYSLEIIQPLEILMWAKLKEIGELEKTMPQEWQDNIEMPF